MILKRYIVDIELFRLVMRGRCFNSLINLIYIKYTIRKSAVISLDIKIIE
mgnify:CR=1 FL=1